MTIPSRPAPAPPGSRAQNAAAGANASLEQLRLQLQQQHMQQQQSGNGLQKLTIKLPPPPKGPQQQNGLHKKTYSNNNNNAYNDELTTGGSSITRKFPQARYTPATGWDDSPFGSSFEAAGSGNGNGNFRKVPPPRPPPPKMQLNGHKMSAPVGTGGGSGSGGVALITNIFHRKKSSATAAAVASKAAAQNRVYGLSSGHAAGGTTTTTTTMSHSNTNSEVDWNAAWNSAPTVAATTTSHSHTHFSSSASTATTTIGTGDAQLISFDSPPSSPTFTQKSNSDCVSVDSFSSDSNFSSPNNGSVSQPESGFEDDFHARSRPATNSPLDPWEAVDNFSVESVYSNTQLQSIGTAPVRQLQQTTRLADNPLCNGKSLLPPTQSLTMPTIIKPKISQKPKAPKPPPFLSKPGAAYGGFSSMQQSPESPPMPKVQPPPPPPVVSSGASASGISLLDVITGKVDALALMNGSSGYIEEIEVPYAVALYDFDGVEEGDLNFRENEKIYLLEQPTAEWFRGRTRAGCEGLFPANYVEVMVPLGASASSVKAPVQPSRPTVRCLYNFPGEVEGDLSLREDEMVTVLYRINEDWLFGEVGGRQGQFPANFLEYVPDNLPAA